MTSVNHSDEDQTNRNSISIEIITELDGFLVDHSAPIHLNCGLG